MIRLGLATLITVLVLGGIQYVGRDSDISSYGHGGVAYNGRRIDVVALERAFLDALAEATPAGQADGREDVARRLGSGLGRSEAGSGADTTSLISSYPWPQDEAYHIMICESSGNAGASNSANSIGLFQIHYPSHWDKVESLEALFDPTTNVHVAFHLWEDQGWEPWSDSRHCHGL